MGMSESTLCVRCQEHASKLKKTSREIERALRMAEEEVRELEQINTSFSAKRREIRDKYIAEMQEALLKVDHLHLTFKKLAIQAQSATTLAREGRLVKQMEEVLIELDRAEFRIDELVVASDGGVRTLEVRMDRLLNS